MKIIKTLSRVYVENLDSTISFYESLLNVKARNRFKYPEIQLELASVGNFLLIAGNEKALMPFRSTVATVQVEGIEEFKDYILNKGGHILRDIQVVPTGVNMTAQHPDGSILEYVEFKTT